MPLICPICGKDAHADSKPFCSRRCADTDLARWFNGAYSVASVETDDESDALAEQDQPPYQ
jgi:endogenous inhibitor of DNA gyrase (YacG/DUF329 family)